MCEKDTKRITYDDDDDELQKSITYHAHNNIPKVLIRVRTSHHTQAAPTIMNPSSAAAARRLVILYGIGGLSDVGRHAILAALEQKVVPDIVVITEYPELLDEKNWECGCPGGHTNPTKVGPNASKIVQVVPVVNGWKTPQSNLAQHFQGADAVISCLGHRQPGFKYPELRKKGLVAYDGNKQVIAAMKEANVKRVVVCSSMGIQEDWPPMEFHWAGKAMSTLFNTVCRKSFQDLTAMELAYKEEASSSSSSSSLDYLFVRPVGISEEQLPANTYFLQKEKYKDAVGMDMAKMDVARFMVQEALNPTLHRRGVVIGSEPPQNKNEKKEAAVPGFE